MFYSYSTSHHESQLEKNWKFDKFFELKSQAKDPLAKKFADVIFDLASDLSRVMADLSNLQVYCGQLEDLVSRRDYLNGKRPELYFKTAKHLGAIAAMRDTYEDHRYLAENPELRKAVEISGKSVRR